MSKRSKQKRDKLSVKRETLKRLTRALDDRQLEGVNGAVPCMASIVRTEPVP